MYRAHHIRALYDLCPMNEVATMIRQLHRRYLLCSVRQVQRFVYAVFNLGCFTIAWFVVIALAISRAGHRPTGHTNWLDFVGFELGCCPWNHQVLYSAGHRPWSTGHIGHVLGNAPAFYSFCRKLVLNLSRPADLKPGSVGSYCSRLWHPCSSEGTWRCRLVSDPLATSLHPFATGSFTQLRFLRSSWPVGYS